MNHRAGSAAYAQLVNLPSRWMGRIPQIRHDNLPPSLCSWYGPYGHHHIKNTGRRHSLKEYGEIRNRLGLRAACGATKNA